MIVILIILDDCMTVQTFQRYHQSKCSVNKYVDDFRELNHQAGYIQRLSIVSKFNWGLNKEIQDQIVNIPIRRPDDDNPNAWYEAAIQVDNNRIANELFHSSSHLTTNLKPSLSCLPNPAWPAPTLYWFPHTSNFPMQRPRPPSNRSLMEIDMAKKQANTPDTCWRCRQLGHWVMDCEKSYNIQCMFINKKVEWLQDLAVEMDMRELEEKTEAEVESKAAEPSKDF